jgi:hypothetical protein
MTSVKISQLAQADTLSGSERLPVVQAGQTVGATVDQIRAGLLPDGHAGTGGTAHAAAVAGGGAGFLSGADKAKLNGIQASATSNSTDAQLRDRATHTGTQPHSTISGLGTMATQNAGSVAITGGTASFSGVTTLTNNASPWSLYLKGIGTTWGALLGCPADNTFAVYSAGGTEFLRIEAAGHGRPGVDAAYSWGTAAHRFTEVYAVTGVINTSDERDKELIAPVDPVLATALLRAIDPVTFKWRDVERPAVVETRRTVRQKTEAVTMTRDVVERAGDIFVRRRVSETVEMPVFSEYPLHDESGAPLIDGEGRPILHREPVLEEVDEEIVTAPAYAKFNRRAHWGFVAQQVEAGLCRVLGLDCDDPAQRNAARLRFAGLIHDGASDKYGLREAQFTPILWAVLRDLLDRVEALEGRRIPA